MSINLEASEMIERIARLYIEERGYELIDCDAPYADFAAIADGEVHLFYVGSMGDREWLEGASARRERCPFEVASCNVLDIAISGNDTAVVRHFHDVVGTI